MRARGRGDGLDVDQAGLLGADCPDGLIPNQSTGRFRDAASIIAIPSRSGCREVDVSATSSRATRQDRKLLIVREHPDGTYHGACRCLARDTDELWVRARARDDSPMQTMDMVSCR
jgi:hypothetical protein